MEILEDVVIVGGGIAGLATALALKRVGVQSLVLEKWPELRATGAALGLLPNAWRALDALEVSHKLTSIYPPFEKGSITNLANGTEQNLFFDEKDRETIGARAVHRRALLEALAEELPAEAIRFSSKITSIETIKHEGSSLVILHLQDGPAIKAKAVIGCDGVHSVVGRWLGLKSPTHSGRFAVRAISVFPQGHGLKHEMRQLVGGSSRAGFGPLNDKEIFWFVTSKSRSTDDEDTTREAPELIQQRILEDVADFPPVFMNIVHHCDSSTLTWAPLMLRVPWDLLLNKMYKDNITVAGDAMHPMTPDLAQGGGASLEDAVVLGRHIGNSLAANGRIDSRALEGYVKERRWRVVMLISASYLSGWIQQRGLLKDFLRDKVFDKFFFPLTSNVVNYNCGKLPTVVCAAKETASKKTK